jgi:serine protease AprX
MTTFDPAGSGFCAVGRQLFNGPAIDIFFAGPDGIFQAHYNESQGWTLVPGTANTLNMVPLNAADAAQSFTHSPAVVSWDQVQRLDLFAIDSAGNLWHWWTESEFQPALAWGAESLGQPGHGPLVSAPTAVAQGTDKITVFARVGGDGALFACVWDPTNGKRWAWASASSELGWAPEPGPFVFSPAACSWDPSRIDLFAIKGTISDGGGTVQHTWQQDFPGNPGWHPEYWEAPANFGATSSPVAVSWIDQNGIQEITVLYCGPSGIEGTSVAELQWLKDHWVTNFVFQQTSDLAAIGYPSLASWGSGRLDAFWLANDGTLQHYWNPAGEPRTWQPPESFILQFPQQQ